ncbi:MAG: DUF2807 domain-containing protein [Magnetococcales bacterium]|nr:DUF2807 domain-containing protein [Magnetococcales bacterium]MBF0322253.1 DUF2807 domain-containing protein [Magnetococcales bacterium]
MSRTRIGLGSVFFVVPAILWSGGVCAESLEPLWRGQVEKVRLDGILHPIRIHTHDQPQTVLGASGPLGKDALGFQQQGKVLSVHEKSTGTASFGSHVSTSSFGNRISTSATVGSITQSSGSIEIGSVRVDGVRVTDGASSGREPVRLDLLLSKKVALAVTGSCQQVDIDGMAGFLDVDVGGACTLKAGDVGAARLRADGASSVEITSVAGQLTIVAAGASDIQVKGGEVDQLQIDLTGSGNVSFGGVARKVRVSMQGVGRVTVAKSLTEPDIQIDGVGDVSVGR